MTMISSLKKWAGFVDTVEKSKEVIPIKSNINVKEKNGVGRMVEGENVSISKMVKYRSFVLPNGEEWAVPVKVIALDKAKFYFEHFNKKLKDFNTLLSSIEREFNEDESAIEEWASKFMSWDMVKSQAIKLDNISDTSSKDFVEAWSKGKSSIISLKEEGTVA